MLVDEGGVFWLSNPWLAGALIVLAVGLVLWCHRWLETGRVPAPRAQAVRLSRRERRARPMPVRPTLVAGSTRPAAARLPRHAA